MVWLLVVELGTLDPGGFPCLQGALTLSDEGRRAASRPEEGRRGDGSVKHRLHGLLPWTSNGDDRTESLVTK